MYKLGGVVLGRAERLQDFRGGEWKVSGRPARSATLNEALGGTDTYRQRRGVLLVWAQCSALGSALSSTRRLSLWRLKEDQCVSLRAGPQTTERTHTLEDPRSHGSARKRKKGRLRQVASSEVGGRKTSKVRGEPIYTTEFFCSEDMPERRSSRFAPALPRSFDIRRKPGRRWKAKEKRSAAE